MSNVIGSKVRARRILAVMRATWLSITILLVLLGCGPTSTRVQSQTTQLTAQSAETAKAPAGVDYLVITAPAFADALAPLVKHRRGQGHNVRVVSAAFERAEDVRAVIEAEHQESGELRFVLLAGDASSEWDRHEPHPDRMPTFYLKKLRYGGGNGAYAHRGVYPSDGPYGEIDGEMTMAVGRIPVRTAAEMRAFVQKLLRYETKPVTNPWPRRLVLRAGTADFGAMTDAAIERAALGLLNGSVLRHDRRAGQRQADPQRNAGGRNDRRVGADATGNAGALRGEGVRDVARRQALRGWPHPHENDAIVRVYGDPPRLRL